MELAPHGLGWKAAEALAFAEVLAARLDAGLSGWGTEDERDADLPEYDDVPPAPAATERRPRQRAAATMFAS